MAKWLMATLLIGASAAAWAGQSGGDRLLLVQRGFAEVERSYARVEADLNALVRAQVLLAPGLVMRGEAVTARFDVASEARPNETAELVEQCYDPNAKPRPIRLDWRRGGRGWEATWRWTPSHAGQYLLRWRCDIGGDVPQFERLFAVADRGSAVMVVNSTSHAQPRPEPDLHRLRLPFSGWAEPLLFGERPHAEAFAAFSRNARQYGDDPAFLIFMGGLYVPGDKAVFVDEPPEVQRAVLANAQRIWRMCRFPEPLANLYTYGLGAGPVGQARLLGYNVLGALCADQNWGDGPFKINHFGMPARPYFAAPDDFRRPGHGGANAMVGIQQCARQTMLCRDYNCVYSLEGGIGYALEQYSGMKGPEQPDARDLEREMAFLDCHLDAAQTSPRPLLFSMGFEFNGVWPRMAELNRRSMEALVERARTRKLVFCTANAAAGFLRRRYRETPESALYLHDVFAGITSNGKPARYPDTIEVENARFKALFRRGDHLPTMHYDYTKPWAYPDWGNQDIARRPDGYLVPDSPDRYRVTPRMVDARGVQVRSTQEALPNGVRVRIAIRSDVARAEMPVALWDLPARFTALESGWQVMGPARAIPVRAPFTGNACCVLVSNVPAGATEIVLTVRSQRREPVRADVPQGLGREAYRQGAMPDAGFVAYRPGPPFEQQWKVESQTAAQAKAAADAAHTVLGRDGARFTLNGKPRFLLGCSYYGGLGADEPRLLADLDEMQRIGMNWLRVWATWNAFGEDVSAVDGQGMPRPAAMARLRRLVAECDRRGMVVDVTLSRNASGPAPVLANLATHAAATLAVATALGGHRNWYLDLANERDVRDSRYVPVVELATLRADLRKRWPDLLVTASGGSDTNPGEALKLAAAGMDFICPHRPRQAGSPAQTEASARKLAAALAEKGFIIPIHYQEPFRRGYSDWTPMAADFLTDLRGAVRGGAAGWCFHNGATRGPKDEEPRRSFDLRGRRLFEQLDEEEREALRVMAAAVAAP
jgi:hypothetical protein